MQIDVKNVKIFVTVPPKHVEKVREAVCKAGAGVIGNYSFCTFSAKGMGTFLPNDSAQPYIGKGGKNERVKEEKLEFVCPAEMVKGVVAALRKVHPYEEPAIDIFPLLNEKDFD